MEIKNSFQRIGREVIHKRLLNAPRQLVWEAWTKPEHIKEWWGPQGFSVTIQNMQVQKNGEWNFVMHGMGTDYDNHVVYLEVQEPSFLSFRNGDENDEMGFTSFITFEDLGEKTLLTMRTVLSSEEILDELDRKVNAIEGGKQTMDRMVAYIEGDMGA